MRVTSDLWISAVTRRVFADGGFAAIVRKGATEAGAIFLLVRGRYGEMSLYGPAPQTSYNEGQPEERRFSLLLEAAGSTTLDARIERETRFDQDLWVVEIEPGRTPVAELLEIA